MPTVTQNLSDAMQRVSAAMELVKSAKGKQRTEFTFIIAGKFDGSEMSEGKDAINSAMDSLQSIGSADFVIVASDGSIVDDG